MIAAAYIRVSTEDQLEYSPDAQIKAIQEYSKRNNIMLDKQHIYLDEGISGRKAEKRPAFMSMIANAKKKPRPFDVILIHKFDRFARNREDSVVYKSLLRKECGVKVISITENIEDDKFGIILESMLEAMSEYYSINLAEEVKKGMTEKAYRGEIQTVAPFGYYLEDKKIYPKDGEWEVVKRLFEDFANGKAYLQIAKELNALGYRTHRGNKFENRTIEYILHNPIYVGKTRWTPTGKIRRNYNHIDSIIADGVHEPLVPVELFEKVQKRADTIKATYRKYYKPQYKPSHFLVGVLTCSACGGSLVNNNGSFRCNAYGKGQCDTINSIGIKTIEQAVIYKIEHDVIEKKCADINIKMPQVQKQNDIYTEQLKKVESKLNRIKEAYMSGIDTLDEYKANKQAITDEIKEINKFIKDQTKTPQADMQAFINSAIKVVDILKTGSDDTLKHQYLISIVSKIVHNKAENKLFISYHIKP